MPKIRILNVPVPEAYYYYDPDIEQRRRDPWPLAWHDYCTSSPDSWDGLDVSFRGPCARHDLCIEFKLGEDRSNCDDRFAIDLAANCEIGTRGNVLDLIECLVIAIPYETVVRNTTEKHRDNGNAWGHEGPSSYPTWSWAEWNQQTLRYLNWQASLVARLES